MKTNKAVANRQAEPRGLIPDSSKRVRLGVITGPHGLKGALRFVPDNPDLSGFASLHRLLIDAQGKAREFEVLEAAPVGHGGLKIKLPEIDSIASAEALRGAVVYTLESDLPPPDPGHFYYFAAVGCEVVTIDGRVIGTIAETFFNGGHDTWIVRAGAREYLIPVIADVVRSTDFVSHRVVIEDLPGLLD